MSKEYVMQLEATIENLKRDNALLKELNSKYNDYEKQLGCPLDVIFKALKEGIFIKNIDGEMVNFKCRLTYHNEELGWYFNIINGYVMIKDYKNTWRLKEDKKDKEMLKDDNKGNV